MVIVHYCISECLVDVSCSNLAGVSSASSTVFRGVLISNLVIEDFRHLNLIRETRTQQDLLIICGHNGRFSSLIIPA